jgi:hypothetical protein
VRVIGRPRVAVAAAPLLLALLPTCAGHLPPCPAAGGPAWTELDGTHFRLQTDEDPAAARAALKDLEQLQAALLLVFGAPPDLDVGKLPVVVVDRGWTDFAPRQVRGFFTQALFQPLIIMAAGSPLNQQQVIKHELVHYLSHKVIPNQPRWLSEGLATYYETIEYDADAGRITVGRPSPERLRGAQRASVANIEAMFAAQTIGGDDDAGRFYAAAWVTMHYLINHRAMALVGYQKALRERASPEAAWTAAFGAQTPAQVALDVQRYVDGGRYELLIYKFPAPRRGEPAERRLTDADAHAIRALLYLSRIGAALGPEPEDRRPVARRELDEALRQDPAHVRARAIAHWLLGAPVDFERAAAATRTNAGDWLAWLLLSDAYEARNDRAGWDDAVRHVAELARADRSVRIQGTFSPHP